MNNLTLLYAEDDKEALENTLFFLDECCPTIYTATDGIEALKIYKESKIDIILLDINMPKMSGMEVLREIRKTDDKTEVVFISANTDAKNLLSAINLGVSAFLTKPYNIQELKDVITKIADKKFGLDVIDTNVITSRTDKKGFIIDVSSAFCKLTQYSRDEVIGKTHSIISYSDIPKDIYKDIWATISSGKRWVGEIKNRAKDSSTYWVLSTITPIFGLNNSITGYISVQNDITQKKEMEYLSITDRLTTLYNRGYFDEIIEKEISRSKRYDIYFSFMMIDIDYFKQYNDSYGHQAGDNVLKELSKVLTKHTQREGDYTFRLGGEEFGIITIGLDELASRELAKSVIEDVRALKISHESSLVADCLTISAGLYTIKGSEIFDKDLIYLETDKALYRSKNGGRDMLSIVDTRNLKVNNE